MLSGPSGKGRERQKMDEKGRFRPISRTGGQTPLKPPFVTPPFAALQWGELICLSVAKAQRKEKKSSGVLLFADWGVWIRRGWISRSWGAPIFRPEVPKPFRICILGPLDLKSGRPENAKSNHDGSNPPPLLDPLICNCFRAEGFPNKCLRA